VLRTRVDAPRGCVSVPLQQASHGQQASHDTAACPPAILVFSKTAAFRHDSIPAAQTALRQLATEHGWRANSTEDAALFTYERLAHCIVMIFLLTTGDVLDETQEAAASSAFIQPATWTTAGHNTTVWSARTTIRRTSAPASSLRRSRWWITRIPQPPGCQIAGPAPTGGTTSPPTRVRRSTCS
jgi:hypothetical protein